MRNRGETLSWRRLLAAALCWLAVQLSPAGWGLLPDFGPEAGGSSGVALAEERFVTIDFDDVDITVFIKYISELTGKNFIVDKAVKGNVTIVSPTKISEADAYRVFESVLEVEGFTAVEAGQVVKVVPAADARAKGIETSFASGSGRPDDKLVTQLVPLKYADPEELKKVLAPLISKTSVVISYTPTGTLIVTDVMSNIKRLLQIIEEIDVPTAGEQISVLPLRHASATEVAKSLSSLFERGSAGAPAPPVGVAAIPGRSVLRGGGPAATTLKIIPDERINALIILASEADTARLKELLGQLDAEIPHGEGDIHVYYLQNANAEEMAKVLTTLPGKEAPEAEKGKTPTISKGVQIVADKATNSLVITAPKGDYLAIEEVIKKLDIPRKMVYLEALIMEVNVKKSFALGVEWQGGFSFNDSTGAVFGGSRKQLLAQDGLLAGLSGTTPALPQGMSLGVLGKTILIGGKEFPSIGAILQAYKDDADVHIVSTPQILTTDNQEAEIKVGQNVPYLTSLNRTTGQQDYTNFEYRDVSTTLKITPQINQEGVVRMQINTEILKLANPEQTTDKPTTLKRTANTTVIVQDQSTVVIGGIIGDDTKDDTYKVPALGDIPVLGWLFKSKTTTKERTNLYIFITPRIINHPSEATGVSKEKKEEADWHHEKGFSEPFVKKPTEADLPKLAAEGFSNLRAGRYDAAQVSYEKILTVRPEDPLALLNLGVISEARGEPARAAALYEKVISLNPQERAATSTDPGKEGKTLAEIAGDNLERLQGR